MFSWPRNNILYGTCSRKMFTDWQQTIDFQCDTLKINHFPPSSPSALLSHLLSAQRSLVLHFESLKMSVFNYLFQYCNNVIEFIIPFFLSLPHPFVFFSALYPFTVLRRILTCSMLLLSSSQWETSWGSLLDHLPWDPLMLWSQL